MPPPALWVHARHSGLVASFESGAHAQLLLWRALPRHRPRTTHPTTPAYPPFPRAGIKVTVGGKGAAGAPADSAADFRGAGRGIVWLMQEQAPSIRSPMSAKYPPLITMTRIAGKQKWTRFFVVCL